MITMEGIIIINQQKQQDTRQVNTTVARQPSKRVSQGHADELLDYSSSNRLTVTRPEKKLDNYSFLGQISAIKNRLYLAPVGLRHNILSFSKEAGASSSICDIENNIDNSGDNSSERLCTVSTRQYYRNNSTTSITNPYDINHSKQSSAIVLQNARKVLQFSIESLNML
uniref:Uncharacterized protein n=1 Tax=Onchocerca volvulus TaxID=6282 RepID=A0A8R1TKI6_ONCVO